MRALRNPLNVPQRTLRREDRIGRSRRNFTRRTRNTENRRRAEKEKTECDAESLHAIAMLTHIVRNRGQDIGSI